MRGSHCAFGRWGDGSGCAHARGGSRWVQGEVQAAKRGRKKVVNEGASASAEMRRWQRYARSANHVIGDMVLSSRSARPAKPRVYNGEVVRRG